MAGLFQFILKRASQSRQGGTVDDDGLPQWASEPVASLVRYPLVWQRCRKLPQSGADIFCWSPLPLFIYPPDGRASLLSSHPVCFLTFHRLSSTTPWVMLLFFFFLSKVQSFKQCVYILLWWGQLYVWRDSLLATEYGQYIPYGCHYWRDSAATCEEQLPQIPAIMGGAIMGGAIMGGATICAPLHGYLAQFCSVPTGTSPMMTWFFAMVLCSALFSVEVLVWQERSTEKSGSSMETENSFPSQYKDIMHVWPETEGAVTWRKTDRDREAQW